MLMLNCLQAGRQVERSRYYCLLHGRMSEVLALKTPSTVFAGAKINVDEVCEKTYSLVEEKSIKKIYLIYHSL